MSTPQTQWVDAAFVVTGASTLPRHLGNPWWGVLNITIGNAVKTRCRLNRQPARHFGSLTKFVQAFEQASGCDSGHRQALTTLLTACALFVGAENPHVEDNLSVQSCELPLLTHPDDSFPRPSTPSVASGPSPIPVIDTIRGKRQPRSQPRDAFAEFGL